MIKVTRTKWQSNEKGQVDQTVSVRSAVTMDVTWSPVHERECLLTLRDEEGSPVALFTEWSFAVIVKEDK